MGCPRAASLLEPSACLRVRPHVFVGREAEAQPAHPADARGLAELERRERSGGGGRALLCTVSCLRCSCCCRLLWLLYFGRTDACFPSILRHEDHLSHHLHGAEAVAQRRPHLALELGAPGRHLDAVERPEIAGEISGQRRGDGRRGSGVGHDHNQLHYQQQPLHIQSIQFYV